MSSWRSRTTRLSSPAFPYDNNALIKTYKSGALDVTKACPSPQTSTVTSPCGWSCSSGDCGTHSNAAAGVPPTFPPTPPSAPVGPPDMSTQVTYVPGNVQLTSGATGSGILIVDGDRKSTRLNSSHLVISYAVF